MLVQARPATDAGGRGCRVSDAGCTSGSRSMRMARRLMAYISSLYIAIVSIRDLSLHLPPLTVIVNATAFVPICCVDEFACRASKNAPMIDEASAVASRCQLST